MKTTIVIGVAFAVIRIWMGFNVAPEPLAWSQAYKDAAHLFVGGLAGSWWYSRARWQWWLFWSLNVVEVVTAVLSRH